MNMRVQCPIEMLSAELLQVVRLAVSRSGDTDLVVGAIYRDGEVVGNYAGIKEEKRLSSLLYHPLPNDILVSGDTITLRGVE